jgi:hypothetical protein
MKSRFKVCYNLQVLGLYETCDNCFAICSDKYTDGYVKREYSRNLFWLVMLVSNAEYYGISGNKKIILSREEV